jgi:hypothetical protein
MNRPRPSNWIYATTVGTFLSELLNYLVRVGDRPGKHSYRQGRKDPINQCARCSHARQKNADFLFREAHDLGGGYPSAGLHRSQTLGKSSYPRSILFKCNLPRESPPERLYNAKISRALWLVRFSGEARLMLRTLVNWPTDVPLSVRNYRSLLDRFCGIFSSIPKRRIRSKASRFGGCQSARSKNGCLKRARL